MAGTVIDLDIDSDRTRLRKMENTTENGASMKVSDYVEYDVGMALTIYVLPVVIIAGSVGNFLSFLVLMRRPMRDTSVYFYLAMLAIADTCVLYLSGFKTWMRVLVGYELLHMSNAGCKSIMFFFLVSLHMSAWLVVAMTVDRFVAVWFPFKASHVCVVRRARTIFGISLLITILYNLHIIFKVHLLTSERGGKTTFHCAPMYDDYFMVKVFPMMKLISYSALPFTLVLLLNIAIILKLWLNHSLLKDAREDSPGRTKSTQNKITVMLLIVSFVWLVLTAPFTLEPFVRTSRRDTHARAQRFLVKAICFLLLYTNHSVNFYIYCVTGRKFRIQLLNMFCACCSCCRRNSRSRSIVESRTYKTQLHRTNSPWHQRETIALKSTVVVTYNECK